MFCRCPNGFGARAEHDDVPHLPRPPGVAAGAEPHGGRVDDRSRPGAGLRDRRARASSTARATSIPTSPKGYQISQYDEPLCVDGSFRRPGRRRRSRGGDRPRPPRGGRGEDRPCRRRGREDRRRGPLARRLQPRRRAARRDRHAARPPFRRRCEALPPAAAPDGRRARRLRCGDGEGNDALSTPTCPCARRARRATARAGS